MAQGIQEFCAEGEEAEGEMRPEGRELVGRSGAPSGCGKDSGVDSSELGSHGKVLSRGEMGSDFHF